MSEILSIGELLDLGGSASTAGLIPYSALEYSAQVITGISGTAIGGQGGTDSATVSAIASAYAESAASGKLDNSASGLWYPLEGNPSGFLTNVDLSPYAYASSVSSKVDQSAFDNCCSAMSSVVSSLETSVTSMSSVVSALTGDYLEKSASSMFQPSGDYQSAGDYAFNSSLSGKLDVSASSMFQPSGDYQTAGDYAFNSSVSSKLDASASSQFAPSGNYAYESALSSYIPVSASSQFAPSGDYAEASALSGKLDASASSQFQPSGNYQPSGDYQTAGNYMSASESSAFYPMTGNPSGFLVEHQSLTAYQDRSSISAWTADMSSISGKLDQSAFTSYSSTVNNNITSIENNITAISSVVSGKADASAVHTYTGIDPIVVDNENDQISLSASAIHFDSTMRSYVSGGSGFVGVNGSYLSGVAHDTSLSGDGSEAYPLGVSNYAGQYTSPSATIDIDNVNGTLEATRSAIRHLPAISMTGTLRTNNNTALLDYAPTFIAGRSATLTFTNISGATQFSVSGLTYNDTAVYRYIGSGTSVTIPSSLGDILFISGNHYGWSADVRISASSEPDRVDPLLYSSDNYVKSIVMHSAGYPYIVGLNKWPISASRAESAKSADRADTCTYADSALSAGSAYKSVSAQAALKYFTGASTSDTAFISSLANTYGYADSKITAINGSAIMAGSLYTSPSGTIAVDNMNDTLESWNSSLRVDEHVTAASSIPGTARQVSNEGYFTLWTGSTLPGDILYLSAYWNENAANISASAFGVKQGGASSKVSEFMIDGTSSASASASIADEYTGITMILSST